MAMTQQPQTLQQRHQMMHGFDAPHHLAKVGTHRHTSTIDVASLPTTS
jgi:hypothetical protein